MSSLEQKQKLLEDIKTKFGSKVRSAEMEYDMPVVVIDKSIHKDLATWLKEHEEWKFQQFTDITAVDYTDKEKERFQVVVHLRSVVNNMRVRIKTPLAMPEPEKNDKGEVIEDPDAQPEIDTLTDVFIGALWSEREVFDLMGINFIGHPRMTRILLPDDFEGHPLRKDFPVKGRYRGQFPGGSVTSGKRREKVSVETAPVPLDQIMPNTPDEMKREPMRPAGEGGEDA